MEKTKGPPRWPWFQGLLPAGGVANNVVAGVTLAALAIPEVMGYTKISGTPVITGLYTMLVPVVVYAVFGASRHLVVAADSATAAILAAGLTGLAVPRTDQWMAMAGVLALMAAAFLFLARLARLGFLAHFLSRTVLIGFLTGVGLQVALGEVPGILGLPSAGGGSLAVVQGILAHGAEVSWPILGISVTVIVGMVGAHRISKKIPAAMIVVVGSLILSGFFAWGTHGIPVIGTIPSGLPHLGIPGLPWDWTLVARLVPTAFAMFVVILAQSAATSRAYAAQYSEPFDENVDLVGLGLANIGAALSGTFVVNGSPTKTQMVESAGGTSQLAHLTAGLVVAFVLLFLTGPLALLPTAVLSALVFLIGVQLVDLRGMRRILAERPSEFWVALVVAASVVAFGVEPSILLAIVLSLVVHTRHGYLVTNRLLVFDGRGWRQRRLGNDQAAPGLVVYRFLHNLYYANAHVLTEDVTKLLSGPPVRWFCLDMAAVNDVDFTAAEALRSLHRGTTQARVRVVFTGVIEETQAEFDRSHLTELFGSDAFFPTLEAMLEAFERDSGRGVGMGVTNREGDGPAGQAEDEAGPQEDRPKPKGGGHRGSDHRPEGVRRRRN